jgi:hypothetical protein
MAPGERRKHWRGFHGIYPLNTAPMLVFTKIFNRPCPFQRLPAIVHASGRPNPSNARQMRHRQHHHGRVPTHSGSGYGWHRSIFVCPDHGKLAAMRRIDAAMLTDHNSNNELDR